MDKVVCIKIYETLGKSRWPLSIVDSHIFNPGDFAEIQEMGLPKSLYEKEMWYYISLELPLFLQEAAQCSQTKFQTSAIWAIEFKELNEHFITLAEWRDKQIDKILEDG